MMAGLTMNFFAKTSFTAQFFGRPEYSDVTVKFSGRVVHCHKLILCTKSDYFKKLCGPDSVFAEQNQREIALLEDDPDAVETVLRHIYTDVSELARPHDVAYLLEVSKAADKYLMPVLRDAAHTQLRNITAGYTDIGQIFQAMQIIRAQGGLPADIELADSLENKHIGALLKHEHFRKDVEKNHDFDYLWRQIDRFNYDDDMILVTLIRCEVCLAMRYKLAEACDPVSTCWVKLKTAAYQDQKCKFDKGKGTRCWMSQKDMQKYNREMDQKSMLQNQPIRYF